MRCLHCGKELALLKRLTGGGQFCSEAHKRSYQEEYNRIGLSRLLQAQRKSSQNHPTVETDQASNAEPASPAAPQETAPAPGVEPVLAAEEPAVAVAEAAAEPAEEKPEEKWEPAETANFILGRPELPTFVDSLPHLELKLDSWQINRAEPVAPEWYFDGQAEPSLPSAEVLPLPFRPNISSNEHPAREAIVTPNEFVPGKASPPGAPAALLSNQLPSSGLIDLAVEPRGAEDAAVAVLDEIRGFPAPVEFQDSALLAPLPSAIEFPAEDADVTLESAASRVASFGPSEETSTGETAVEATEPSEPASPSATLEALARLHEELLEQHEADAQSAQAAIIQTEPVEQIVAEPREETSAIEPVQADPVAMESPMATTAETEDQPQPAVESSPETATVKPQAERGTPQGTGEFVEVPVKSYPPPKPALMEGVGPLFHAPAILPRLTGLPLRPKIGLASPQTAQSLSASQSKNAPAEARSKGPATRDSGATEVPEKAPAKIEKPAVPARTAPVAKSEPAKPATSSAWQKPQPAPVAKTTKSDTDDTARPVPVPARQPNGLKQAEASAKPKVPEKTRTADKPEPAEAKAPKTEAPPAEIRDNEAPIFGAGQLGNTSLMGSFKFKLAIGVVVVAILAVGYFVWGGKPAPSAVNPSPAADKPGPSIMVGGGGWIEGWAGDPVGARLGRQITIYRPSLKLADYRIDFQGSIETKSMGWVFRATDPQNYYAMKLSYVTSGPEPKIALFKYLVAEGHQTQVGRVPIDLAVHLDTQYTVRVDVQGPRFVTYLQGQQVDIWTDDQLKTGAVGFLNEREERARVKSVSVSLLNGARQGAGQ